MTNPTPKFLLALLALTTSAAAEQRTLYDASGRVVGRSVTDSQGTTTVYDSTGRVVGRESTSGSTTTIRDSAGRVVGRVTNR